MPADFVHLSVHTEYSLVDSTVRIKPLIKAVGESMPAVAVTDRGNLFALVKFYRAALNAGIKPIAGVDVRLAAGPDDDQPVRALLLVQNDAGYANLTRLVSRSYQEGQRGGQPVMQRDWLLASHEGLILLSGGLDGDVGQALTRGNEHEAREHAQRWQGAFGDRYYLELTRVGRPNEAQYLAGVCKLAAELNIPVVATNDVRFLEAEDFSAHEARVCIQSGYVLADPKRPQQVTPEQYLKPAEAMCELFADIPSAIENSVQIAQRCNVTIKLGTPVLPDFPIPDGLTEDEFFRRQAADGLEVRLAQLFDTGAADFTGLREAYDDRLAQELDVICQMGFPGYFLIVADFIQWARQNDVPVGPGRGSGAGSLVAYALTITDLDPLEYDLLFERFLNPERVSMPDFDIDFCMDGRDRVIAYVSDKYGAHRVSQIITYGTMAAKAVVRDVGRVMGHPYGFVDRLAKMVPFEVGMTLDKAMRDSEDLARAYKDEEEVTALIDLALALEGLSRNAGKHAGGVVIAPTALTDFTPLYCEADGSSLVTQFDKDDAEEVGLVKFDFLGLRTLTIIDNALAEINRRSGAAKLDIMSLPLDDAPTYQLLQKARTTAVFQLESAGMKRLIERLLPDSFEDIIALVALYRPGPLQSGMVDDFVDRKHGRKPLAWPHEDYQLDILKPVLEPTYGIILYQEQVIQIAQVMGGFSLGTADLLRRAMGKKKAAEMAKQRAVFMAGCETNGIDPMLAGNIFDLVEKFAGYGFNKSHSAAYALLSYQTAWLKCHHPAAFMSAVLSADMDNTDKVVVLIEECGAMGLTVLLPDINASQIRFSVRDAQTVRYGLAAIKGVGEAALAAVLTEREANGPYTSLDDLCRRAGSGNLNKRVLEALARAGALDALGVNRASVFAHVGEAMRGAEQVHRDQAAGQNDLFGLELPDSQRDAAADLATANRRGVLPDWSERERLRAEKETLGLYLSGHPIAEFLDELGKFTQGRLQMLCDKADAMPVTKGGGGWQTRGVPVIGAGLVLALRFRDMQRGGKTCFATLDDKSGRVEVEIRGELLEQAGHLVKKEEVLVVEGEISPDDFNGGFRIRANAVHDLPGARARFARRLRICLHAEQLREQGLDELVSALSHYKSGTTPVCFDYHNGEARASIQAGRQWLINPAQELMAELNRLTGANSVELQY